MPQLILEFSSNVIEKNNILGIFQECHSILTSMLPTELDSCKSRAFERTTYCVGDGQPKNAFVHVTLKVMPGRSLDTLQRVGDSIMSVLRSHFTESLKNLNLQITLEIIELQETYFKISS